MNINSNNSVLLKRFNILSSDSDVDIKLEISHQIKYICDEVDEDYININLIKPVI
jgi:hypothetical protein